ncbi:MAG: hypothetical protein ACXV7G_12500 [Halobacteriota archaeon]
MAEKEQQDVEEQREEKRKKGKRMYDETKTGDTGEGPLYPPEGGSYIHN